MGKGKVNEQIGQFGMSTGDIPDDGGDPQNTHPT